MLQNQRLNLSMMVMLGYSDPTKPTKPLSSVCSRCDPRKAPIQFGPESDAQPQRQVRRTKPSSTCGKIGTESPSPA